MAKKRSKKKNPEELSTENELMKLKMMAEFGGDVIGGEGIPPEIENMFLKQIINFHKNHDHSKHVSIYKYIGEPEYNHVNDLSEKEIEKELKRLVKLMAKKGVGLSALSGPPKREIYRFITEELFKHEIEDVKMKGWVNQFIYEDFHPNPEYDVSMAADSFLQVVFDKRLPFYPEQFSEEMKDHIGLSTDPEEIMRNVEKFKERFTQLKLLEVKIEECEIDEDAGTAHVIAEVKYKTQSEKGKRFKTETAQAEFNLIKDKEKGGWWEINQVITDLF